MISREHECIFVHIPKCGGSSIEEMLWPPPRGEGELWGGFVDRYHNKYQTGGLQHLMAWQIRMEAGPEVFRRYYKFSMVRNPWDKVVSQFLFMRRRPDLRDYLGMALSDPLEKYLELIAKRVHVQWEEQHKFLCDEQGTPLVDFVGRFERFEEDVRKALEELDVTFEAVPHLRKSERRPYREYYSYRTRKMVANIYHRDIELFEYQY